MPSEWASPRIPSPRVGDEIVVAGEFLHTDAPNRVVCWFDPGGFDAYRTTPALPVDTAPGATPKQVAELGGAKGEVRVWDSRSRRLISTLKEHCQAVVGVECLGDDVHVVSASRDRSIITWDLVHERRVAQHTQRVGSINAFELHRADGRDATRMVSVGQDRSLAFWDLMEDRASQVVPGAHAQECTCASLSPHGVLATGSKDQSVKLWDFETGALLAAEHAHCEAVRAVAFSKDGATLVSGGDDGIVMVWSVQVAT